VERFLGDLALDEGWTVRPPHQRTGKRVLIVGAGPSGLSAAWHLALLGHTAVVHEAGPVAGGMMHFGIPRYRLPREVLEAEIGRVSELGVEIVLNHTVTDLMAERASGRFDAVFLAVGAHLSRRQEIPAADASRIYDALQFLEDVERGGDLKIGRRVAVYGGGNTAMDAARTARRLGADPLIIYRRTRAQMPAHDFEADEAIEEGVSVHWLRTIKQIDATAITVEIMQLDDRGAPQPTGLTETLEADSLILAIGQDADTAFLRNVPGLELRKDGTAIVGADMQTGCAGIFAGGDMVPFDRTVTTAVGHGKNAARHIDAWLRGCTDTVPAPQEHARFDTLRPWYHARTGRRPQPRIDLEQRRNTFAEVLGGFDGPAAHFEAGRCLSCGNCFECDGCYGACPEGAVIKLGPGRRYRFDPERCTGCAICFDQCPCGAIAMVAG
jgi:NADPH-dependent glutamate synthase beta subunit-like oxidoreductase